MVFLVSLKKKLNAAQQNVAHGSLRFVSSDLITTCIKTGVVITTKNRL